jgi:hypothetical protein
MMNRMCEVFLKIATRDDKKVAIVKMKYPGTCFVQPLKIVLMISKIFLN